MANTYTWKVNSLITLQNPNPNYVICASWTYNGNDGKNIASIDGKTDFSINNNNPNFIPYEKLTANNVIDWIKQTLGNDNISILETNINNQLESIDKKSDFPIIKPLPWVK